MPPTNTISDDWHDVGDDVVDDNLSVISLATSEPSSPQKSSPRAKPAAVSTADSVDGDVNMSGVINEKTAAVTVAKDHGGVGLPIRVSELQGSIALADAPGGEQRDSPSPQQWHEAQSEPPVEDPFKDPPSQLTEVGCAEDDDKDEQRVEDVADPVEEIFDDSSRNQDPMYLYKTLLSVEDILRDTRGVVDNSTVVQPALTKWAGQTCAELLSQVLQLSRILAAYAKTSTSSGEPAPIDSGLHDWLSNVRVKALGVQAELQTARRIPGFPQIIYGDNELWEGPIDVAQTESEVVKVSSALADCKAQMDEFLPIMKADYDEFQTKSLAFATASLPVERRSSQPPFPAPAGSMSRSAPIDIPQAGATSPRESNVDPSTANTLRNPTWHLRRELYELKDVLQRTTTKLNFGSVNSRPTVINAWCAKLAERYTAVVSVISVALSNHGSDWLESTISGGNRLSFAEFRQLNRETLALYRTQLVEIVGKEEDDKGTKRSRDRGHLSILSRPSDDELALLQGLVDDLEFMFKLRPEPLVEAGYCH